MQRLARGAFRLTSTSRRFQRGQLGARQTDLFAERGDPLLERTEAVGQRIQFEPGFGQLGAGRLCPSRGAALFFNPLGSRMGRTLVLSA